jgi:uncharacterized protein YutE (UPF0331/DUF86 family)
LLIRKGDEAIIVEVKSRASLAKESQVSELARLLRTKPDWNFELVVVGEEDQWRAPAGARPFAREDILRGLEAAEKLLEAGFSEAALLLAWSASEATVRLLVEEEGIVLERLLTPLYILKQAAMHGVVSREAYHSLTKIVEYRNALVHGFKPVDFESTLVTELKRTSAWI